MVWGKGGWGKGWGGKGSRYRPYGVADDHQNQGPRRPVPQGRPGSYAYQMGDQKGGQQGGYGGYQIGKGKGKEKGGKPAGSDGKWCDKCSEWWDKDSFDEYTTVTTSGKKASNQEAKPWCRSCKLNAQVDQFKGEVCQSLSHAEWIIKELTEKRRNERINGSTFENDDYDRDELGKSEVFTLDVFWKRLHALHDAMKAAFSEFAETMDDEDAQADLEESVLKWPSLSLSD